jgi:nucleotide-binding universal stress UspA family protein
MLVLAFVEDRSDRWLWVRRAALWSGTAAVAADAYVAMWGEVGLLVGVGFVVTSPTLLVLGSRGRGAVKSMLLGSVSAAVSAEAACPVVVCRPPAEGPTREGIVVGADGTPESLPVIDFAYRQAYLRKVPLTVLHSFFDAAAAVAQYRRARGLPADGAELDELRAGLAESVAGLAADYPGVDVTITLEHGFADQALSPRHGGWDMVVVGRHPLSSLPRVLTGSLATSVVERARATVAVVPEMEARRPGDAPRRVAGARG